MSWSPAAEVAELRFSLIINQGFRHVCLSPPGILGHTGLLTHSCITSRVKGCTQAQSRELTGDRLVHSVLLYLLLECTYRTQDLEPRENPGQNPGENPAEKVYFSNCLFIYCANLLIYLLSHSLTYSLTYSLTHSHTTALTCSLPPILTHSLIYLLTLTLMHSLSPG